MRAVIPKKFHYHPRSRFSGKRYGFAKIAAACMIIAGVGLTTGLLGYFSDSLSRFPFSCNLPECTNASVHRSGAAGAPPDSEASNVQPDVAEKPVEISDMTSAGDTLFLLFSLGLGNEQMGRQVAQSLATAIQASLGRRFRPSDEIPAGRRFVINLDSNGEFKKGTIELDPSHVFHCRKEDNGLRSWKEDVVLEYKTEVRSFKIQRGIVHSVRAAHEGKELALKLLHVFRWDIDFQVDPRLGDRCTIVFERRYADDRPAGYGRILFAEYQGKRTGRKTALLFNGRYYDEHGVELKRDYLRAPLNTLRITSGFGWRVHPVLKVWKFHKGVDYGAPTGTPVFAIANGTVTFQGRGPAYGLYVIVRHKNGWESRYSHLSRILVKKGQSVKQRQTIGLVGSTGRSTGPHLFFQIIANGKPLNPTKVKLIRNPKAVPTPLRGRFETVRDSHKGYLQQAAVAGAQRS